MTDSCKLEDECGLAGTEARDDRYVTNGVVE